jgi:hypothetical protein
MREGTSSVEVLIRGETVYADNVLSARAVS